MLIIDEKGHDDNEANTFWGKKKTNTICFSFLWIPCSLLFEKSSAKFLQVSNHRYFYFCFNISVTHCGYSASND